MNLYVALFYSALFLTPHDLSAAQAEKPKMHSPEAGLIIQQDKIKANGKLDRVKILLSTFSLPYPGYKKLPEGVTETVVGYQFTPEQSILFGPYNPHRFNPRWKITGLPKDPTGALEQEYE